MFGILTNIIIWMHIKIIICFWNLHFNFAKIDSRSFIVVTLHFVLEENFLLTLCLGGCLFVCLFVLQEHSSFMRDLLLWDSFSSTAAFLRRKGRNWRKLNAYLRTHCVHVAFQIQMTGGILNISGWREVITIFLTMMLLMWNDFQLLVYLIKPGWCCFWQGVVMKELFLMTSLPCFWSGSPFYCLIQLHFPVPNHAIWDEYSKTGHWSFN